MDEYQPSRGNVLLQAIRDQNLETIHKHLSTGLNDVPLRTLSHNAACYLRFAPALEVGDMPPALSAPYYQREDVLLAINRPQISRISDDEVEDRLEDCVARFWTGIDFPSRNVIPHSDTIPAIIEAAQGNSLAIVDLLCKAGAETSFWKTESFEIPLEATPSSLAVSTPLHAAIWSRNFVMLDHLLNLGFNADAMPLANPTRCITPLMATVVYCNPWNKNAFYRLLREFPEEGSANPHKRTPIFDVHILHFAAARLDCELLRCVSNIVPLHNAGKTALGHTLLHVACLPLSEKHVQMHSKEIYESIHEIRSLSEESAETAYIEGRDPEDNYVQARDNIMITKRLLSRPFTQIPPRFSWGLPSSEYFASQVEVIEYLLKNSDQNLAAVDVHSNTALHYLASYRTVNTEAVDLLRKLPKSECIWMQAKNLYGYTPNDLFVSGATAVEDSPKPFWDDRMSRIERDRELGDRVRAEVLSRYWNPSSTRGSRGGRGGKLR